MSGGGEFLNIRIVIVPMLVEEPGVIALHHDRTEDGEPRTWVMVHDEETAAKAEQSVKAFVAMLHEIAGESKLLNAVEEQATDEDRKASWLN